MDAAAPTAPATAPASVAMPASEARAEASVASLQTARDCEAFPRPVSGKSIGHTSVVFKLELEGGRKVAWKASARNLRDRWRGEVAAYRLGRALGLSNVPVACGHTIEVSALRAAVAQDARATKLLREQLLTRDGKVDGAVFPWIEGLRFWPLETEPLQREVGSWLSGGSIPEEKRDLARQASLLVAFDFLTGNWDRYSGGNVGLDASGTTVLFIDNDAAFMAEPPAVALAKNRARVEATARFSRAFVNALRQLEPSALRAAIGEDASGTEPLLSDVVVSRVAERRTELLTLVDRKCRAAGEAATLYFR